MTGNTVILPIAGISLHGGNVHETKPLKEIADPRTKSWMVGAGGPSDESTSSSKPTRPTSRLIASRSASSPPSPTSGPLPSSLALSDRAPTSNSPTTSNGSRSNGAHPIKSSSSSSSWACMAGSTSPGAGPARPDKGPHGCAANGSPLRLKTSSLHAGGAQGVARRGGGITNSASWPNASKVLTLPTASTGLAATSRSRHRAVGARDAKSSARSPLVETNGLRLPGEIFLAPPQGGRRRVAVATRRSSVATPRPPRTRQSTVPSWGASAGL